MIKATINQASIPLCEQATDQNGEGVVADSGTVRVYQVGNGEILASTPLALIDGILWGYDWQPTALPEGIYEVEFSLTVGTLTGRSHKTLCVSGIGGFVTGAVTIGTSTTMFSTNLSYSEDAFNDSFLLFLDGNLVGQTRQVTDFVGSGGVFTTEAFTEAPGVGDTFVVVNR